MPQVEATELTDDQVTNYVNYFLQADATRTEVTDRAAQTGDTVNIDYGITDRVFQSVIQ